MNILFIHSHRFRKIDNNIFSSGGLSEEVLKRYIGPKDNITVMARIQEENKNTGDNYSEITDHRINILNILLKNIHINIAKKYKIYYYKIIEQMFRTVLECKRIWGG